MVDVVDVVEAGCSSKLVSVAGPCFFYLETLVWLGDGTVHAFVFCRFRGCLDELLSLDALCTDRSNDQR